MLAVLVARGIVPAGMISPRTAWIHPECPGAKRGKASQPVPLQVSADGLPIGVMLGAGFGRESLRLRVSAQLEAAAPWRYRHPPVGLWRAG